MKVIILHTIEIFIYYLIVMMNKIIMPVKNYVPNFVRSTSRGIIEATGINTRKSALYRLVIGGTLTATTAGMIVLGKYIGQTAPEFESVPYDVAAITGFASLLTGGPAVLYLLGLDDSNNNSRSDSTSQYTQ